MEGNLFKPAYSALFLLLLCSLPLKAGQKENWYQEVWCEGMGGKVEHRLKDGRRIDCLTSNYAIEVEFAHKWPEAVGQSLDYSMLTGKRAGIVLIIKETADLQHWERLNTLVQHYRLSIRLWKLGP